jgi:hypothetical protein
MVYHFKNRIHSLEEKNQNLSDTCQTIVRELQAIKVLQQQPLHPSQPQPQHTMPMFPGMFAQMREHLQTQTSPPDSQRSTPPVSPYPKIKVLDSVLQTGEDDLVTETMEDDDGDETYDIHDDAIEVEEVDDVVPDASSDDEHSEASSGPRVVELGDGTEDLEVNIETDDLTSEQLGDNDIITDEIKNMIAEQIMETLEHELMGTMGTMDIQMATTSSQESVQEESVQESTHDLSKEIDLHMDTVSVEEDIQVFKVPEEEEDISVITETETKLSTTNSKKNPYSKMNVQMLRTTVISKGLCSDASKIKKQELLKMLMDHDQEAI